MNASTCFREVYIDYMITELTRFGSPQQQLKHLRVFWDFAHIALNLANLRGDFNRLCEVVGIGGFQEFDVDTAYYLTRFDSEVFNEVKDWISHHNVNHLL